MRASDPQEQREAVDRFQAAVSRYMSERETAVRDLPAIQISDDLAYIYRSIDARAHAIVASRPNAVRGEIFDAEVSALFRSRINDTLRRYGLSPAEILAVEDEEGPAPPPAVNERFAWDAAVATPACVIATLPPLPSELQYRFIGDDLALVDVDAWLIVDVLPEVFAR